MFNTRNNRRLINEQKKVNDTKSPHFFVAPLANNMFEWHFTIRGAKGTDYEGGLYHGKITLPDEYPFKAPDLTFLNQNGRFETNKNVCLSITSYHNESWTPAWNIITIIEAVGAFFLVEESGIGYTNPGSGKRKELALASKAFQCDKCGQKMNEVEALLKGYEKLEPTQPTETKLPEAK
jgi:ubiquitin-conjugating enzyme E2 J1